MGKKELQEKLKAALLAARAICDEAEKGNRELTADERQKIEAALKEAKALKDQLKVIEGDEELKRQILEMGAGIELNERTPSQQPGMPAGKGQTLGERYVNSAVFQAWMKQVAPSGQVPESLRGLSCPPVEFKNLGLFRKDLITGLSDVSAGAFINTDITGIYEAIGRYPLVLRDLISVRTTTSDLVEFVQQTQQVHEAAPVPEANVKTPTGATGEITGTKPQGAMYFQKVQEAVKTIAVYVGVTKRALSDAGQIRGIIDQELREDLNDELEDQLLNGNGVGENFTGIANQAGTLIQAFNTNILTTCRQAITTLLVTGRQIPSAWVFNPTDWETIELLQDAVNRYYGNGPWNQGPRVLWGVPVVQSFHKVAGTALLANWKKAVLWDRERASISMTDSHDDWFIRNMVAILAELRAAFGLIRPTAFVDVALA
ncbi:MAG TPA: phage major capsid protein [Anaerolineales bacterium]|nr:phage major capsid protein [Anaerolineales bacterium]